MKLLVGCQCWVVASSKSWSLRLSVAFSSLIVVESIDHLVHTFVGSHIILLVIVIHLLHLVGVVHLVDIDLVQEVWPSNITHLVIQYPNISLHLLSLQWVYWVVLYHLLPGRRLLLSRHLPMLNVYIVSWFYAYSNLLSNKIWRGKGVFAHSIPHIFGFRAISLSRLANSEYSIGWNGRVRFGCHRVEFIFEWASLFRRTNASTLSLFIRTIGVKRVLLLWIGLVVCLDSTLHMRQQVQLGHELGLEGEGGSLLVQVQLGLLGFINSISRLVSLERVYNCSEAA